MLTRPPTRFVLFVDLRAYCHRSLAKLPPEASDRSTVTAWTAWPSAGSAKGQSRRDTASLRRVVDLAFCSSWGDEALELLGDMAFQDGRFGEALAMYRPLVPDRPDDTFGLVHPDPSVDLARIAAKKLLCRAAAGEKLIGWLRSWRVSASGFRELPARWPGARGRTRRFSRSRSASTASLLRPSPTAAGRRSPVLSRAPGRPEPIDVGSLQWKVPLERIAPNRPGYGYGRNMPWPYPALPQDRFLGYHPIVLGDQVIVGDGSRVLAFNLNDRPGSREGGGPLAIEPAWKHDPENPSPRRTG